MVTASVAPGEVLAIMYKISGSQMAEHSARTNSAISEIAAYFGTLARVVHDHENDDERHN